MKTCLRCDKPLTNKPAQAKFCSKACYDAHRQRPIKTCLYCGKPFQVSEHDRANKYCSMDCYNSDRAEKARLVNCPECGKPFHPAKKGTKYCSKQCANRARGRLLSRQVQLTCENCGQPYMARARDASISRFCSASCRSHWVATHRKRNHKDAIENHGYRFVLAPNGEYVPEHIFVWEQAFGPIPPDYVVHHKNNDGLDNRLENLEIMTRSEHRSLHNKTTHPMLLENKKDYYLLKLSNLAKLLGRAPTRREVDAIAGIPASGTFRKACGSWSKALERIGLEPLKPGSGATLAKSISAQVKSDLDLGQ